MTDREESLKIAKTLRQAFAPWFSSKTGDNNIINADDIDRSLSPMRCLLLEGEQLCEDGRTMSITLGQDSLGEKFTDLGTKMADITASITEGYELAKSCRFGHSWTRWSKRGVLRRNIEKHFGTGPDNSQWNVLMIRECVNCGDIEHKEYKGPAGIV